MHPITTDKSTNTKLGADERAECMNDGSRDARRLMTANELRSWMLDGLPAHVRPGTGRAQAGPGEGVATDAPTQTRIHIKGQDFYTPLAFSSAVEALVASLSSRGISASYLYIGRRESGFLKAQSFGNGPFCGWEEGHKFSGLSIMLVDTETHMNAA